MREKSATKGRKCYVIAKEIKASPAGGGVALKMMLHILSKSSVREESGFSFERQSQRRLTINLLSGKEEGETFCIL